MGDMTSCGAGRRLKKTVQRVCADGQTGQYRKCAACSEVNATCGPLAHPNVGRQGRDLVKQRVLSQVPAPRCRLRLLLLVLLLRLVLVLLLRLLRALRLVIRPRLLFLAARRCRSLPLLATLCTRAAAEACAAPSARRDVSLHKLLQGHELLAPPLCQIVLAHLHSRQCCSRGSGTATRQRYS